MADDGGWGDLLSKASEIPTSTTDDNQVTTTTRIHEKKLKKKDKKRKRKRQDDDDDAATAAEEVYQSMLDSRMMASSSSLIGNTSIQRISSWPSWMRIGSHLYRKNKCAQWKFDDDDDDDDDDGSATEKCQNCGQSALHHRAQITLKPTSSSKNNNNTKTETQLEILAVLRNIRCCAKILITSDKKKSNNSAGEESSLPIPYTKELIRSIRDEANNIFTLLSILRSQLPSEEYTLLESKIHEVGKYPRLLHANNNNNKDGDTHRLFVNAVKLIIACDAAYYRLYYLQLTRMLPTSATTTKTKHARLLHPDEYFGLDHFTQDLQEGRRAHLKLKKNIDKNNKISHQWDRTCGDDDDWIKTGDGGTAHPLARIWLYRCCYETSVVFDDDGDSSTGWKSNSMTKTIKSLLAESSSDGSFESRHETPAPSPLAEWRDSCRDFMCNLYAYATLHPKTVQEVTSILKEKELGVIEVGAGTGYVAKLLLNAGVNIEAWDVHPTPTVLVPNTYKASSSSSSSINEYHGATPSFCLVQKSSSLPISSSSINSNITAKALLLCYPPPQSPMAVNTLRAYLKAGGKYLVHIGEFKGLTGNSNFERELLQSMYCQYRSPCLPWGTDASHVTIWTTLPESKAKQKKDCRLLLPCVQCGSNEAQKRCRLLRSLVYCSKSCFKDHAKARKALLRVQMIEVEGIEKKCLDFKNKDHFSKL